jgi:hypothetical protein
LLTFQMEDWCYMLYHYSLSEFLPARIDNALYYIVTKNIIDRPDIKSILYTIQSLDASATVDDFKFRMGYIAKPVPQRIVLHPWLKIVMNGTSYKLIDLLKRCLPGNSLVAKTEGMLRFYQEQEKLTKKQSLLES